VVKRLMPLGQKTKEFVDRRSSLPRGEKGHVRKRSGRKHQHRKGLGH